MATDNDDVTVQGVINSKNINYQEMIAKIDSLLDRLNDRLSTDGTAGGSDEDAATDAAVVAAKVQTAIIGGRVDVLFPYVQREPNSIEIVSGVVEDAAPTLIVLALSEPGVITDATGFTISGSTLATSISAAVISGDGFGVLTLTANGAVANGETVLISYNGATGNLVNKNNEGDTAESVTDLAITNNVA